MKTLKLTRWTLILGAAIAVAIVGYTTQTIDEAYSAATEKTVFETKLIPKGAIVLTKNAELGDRPVVTLNTYKDFLALSEGHEVSVCFAKDTATYTFTAGGRIARFDYWFWDKAITNIRYIGHGTVLIERDPVLAQSLTLDLMGALLVGALAGAAIWIVTGLILMFVSVVPSGHPLAAEA